MLNVRGIPATKDKKLRCPIGVSEPSSECTPCHVIHHNDDDDDARTSRHLSIGRQGDRIAGKDAGVFC